MSIQGEVENCLAWECAGCAKSDLPKDRPELKRWHRSGKIDDINSFTQSDIEDTANKVINIMKRQLSVGGEKK